MAKTTLKQVNDSPLKISINGQLARQRKTLDDLRNAITSAESWIIPQRVNLYQIYQDIVLDAHLTAVTDQRILMSLSREFKIIDDSGQEYPQLTEVLDAQWFRDFCRYALDSVFWGHSLIQFGDILNGTFTACHLLPRHLVRAERKMWLTVPGSVNGIDYTQPPYSDWVIEVGGERDLGMLAKAAFQVLSKRFVFSSWDEFASVFGLPTKVVKINALAGDSSDKSEIASEIAKLGPSSTIVIDDTQSLEFQQVSNTDAYRVYKDLIDARNSELSKLVLGQTGTTDEKTHVGSANVHAEVANTYSQADMKFLKGVINDKLIPLMQRHKLLPLGIHFDYDSTERLGMTDQIAIDVAIAGMGFELNQNYLQDKYGTQIVGLKQATEMNVSKGDGEDAPVGKSENSVSAEVENYYQYELNGHVGCSHEVVNAGEDRETFDDEELDKLIKQIYEGNVNKEALPENIYKETAKRLLTGCNAAFSKPDISKTLQADSKFVQKIKNNIHFFSAAKTYTQVVELGNLITKEDGSRRTFNEFQAAAMPVAKNYNQNYLRAEYDATVAGSRMGAQWQEMEDNADVFPNLKYVTIGDSQVRPAHKELDGVTRPMKDSFWDSNYPPNGWGCRCTVYQMGADVKLTATHALPVLNETQQPPVFRNNVGKTGEVFTEEHPYFIEKGAKEAAAEMAKDDIVPEPEYTKADAPHEGDKIVQHGTDGNPIIPVSSHFTTRSKKIKGQLDSALNAIDSVHSDGVLDSLKVTDKPKKGESSDVWGYIQPARVIKTNKLIATEFYLQPNRYGGALTAVHEIGHCLDMKSFGGEKYGSEIEGSGFYKVVDVINKTKTIEKLIDNCKNGYIHNGKPIPPLIDEDFSYITSRKEVLARAYAQYIAVKSNDKRLKIELDIMLNPSIFGMRVALSQWEAEDFKPVIEAFDTCFQEMGWLNKK